MFSDDRTQDREAVLVDTDVISNLLRGGDRAEPWLHSVEGVHVLLCFATVGELFAWAESSDWGPARRSKLTLRLEAAVIIPFDFKLTEEYGRVFADATKGGHALAGKEHANDRWIAATARLLGVPLLTGNRKHFAGLPGVALVPSD